MAIVRMLHVALGVTEIARSLTFYRDLLGFTVVRQTTFVGAASGRALGVSGDAFDAVLGGDCGHGKSFRQRYSRIVRPRQRRRNRIYVSVARAR